ncbi:MAG: ABC transporter permease [Candidatus Aminicenantes bacterium]|jgi:putative ABC transport system permease protein
MIRNYIKLALRSLQKHKAYSFINISGLAIGMSCCILILLYVADELSYDTYHEKANRIYRVGAISSIGTTTRHYATVPPALAPELVDAIPEVEASVRIFDSFELQGRLDGENIRIPDVFFMDSTFFDVFTHKFIAGDRDKVFANPDSIVITEATARRLFGEIDPIGKTISLPPERSLLVTGVIKDVPKNSHFIFNGIIPTTFIRDAEGRPHPVLTAPYFCEVYSYLVLKEDADPEDVERKIMATHEAKWGKMFKQRGTTRQYPLMRLKDIHLRSTDEYEIGTPGDINNVYLFSAIALLVLIIACLNFINLSTARSTGRAREVGVRKVFGSKKNQLIRQFLSESVAVTLISLFFAIAIVMTVLPLFNDLSGKQFESSQLLKLPALLGFLGIIILTGFIAGSFPAFILSTFQPVMVLRGKFSSASKNTPLRKILVVVQFAISIFMIVGILTMVRQLDYMKNKELGFKKEQLLVSQFFGSRREEENAQKFDSLRDRILKNPNVTSLSFSANIPGGELGYDAYLPEGRSDDETIRARNYWVGFDFVKTYGMEIVHGRDFSREFSTDAGEAIIINQKMARVLGWGDDCLGKRIYNIARENRLGRIVGVVKDFHSGSMREDISPVILSCEPEFFSFVTARILPVNVPSTLSFLETNLREVSQEVFPNREFTFDYHFVDDDFRNKYAEEEKAREIYFIFGALAIFIACLGLFGLASFTLEQRTKEIGVRKVLGASVNNIIVLLSKEFAKLVLIANILAWPLAFYAMKRWLGNFAYRIGIGWDIFVISGLLAIAIALITVCFHSVRAALANPATALRYE